MNSKKRSKKHGKKTKSQQNEKPNWQPVSMIPMIASIIDGEVENLEDLYKNLCEARKKPHVMDDITVDRAIGNHKRYLEEAWVYDEQITRWKKENLTGEQRREIERLAGQMVKYRKMCEEIIAVSEEIKKGTINRILEMSEEELAMAVLSGKLKMPEM
ncbi:hypothetical protein C4588_01895 [Candidatus Parcubacteria bacterium]|nr:MAG: hypothetical protein C4588_01895 [Candidatus Parcubacteria bacterium]